MRKHLAALAACAAFFLPHSASANFAFTVGSGTTAVAIDSTNQGTSGCAAATTECFAHVLIDTTGTALGTTAASTAATQAQTALVTRNADIGTIGDAAYTGSGNATLISIGKGNYTALTSPIVAGTNTIGGFFGSLQTGATIGAGWSQKLLNNLLATTATSVKSSAAGQVSLFYCYNPNATVAYLQVFDAATAGAVTLGSTAPNSSWAIPPTQASGFAISQTGIQFTNGIQVAATTTATGASAPSTGMDCSSLYH